MTTARATRPSAEQSVVVRIANELYGVDITSVQEIIRVPHITRVPNGPEHALGVINLRGRIVPVMNTGALLGAERANDGVAARVVIVNTTQGAVGLRVDAVSEVLEIDPETVEAHSALTYMTDTDLLRGVVKLEGRLIGLLNLERLMPGPPGSAKE